MNILILNWRDPMNKTAGGAELVTLEHAKAWTKAGHTVTWFSSRFSGASRREVIDGIEIVRWGSSVFGVHVCAFFWYVLSRRKFTIVIDQIHGLPFFTPLYVRTRKLANIHEVAKEVWQLNPWPKPFNLIPAFFGSVFEPWIFKLIYRNIPFWTASNSTREDLLVWGIPEENITVIHNGIHIPQRKEKIVKEKKKTAMYLGALALDKGINDLIRAFSAIYAIENDWQFWIVGHGDAKEIHRLQNLCKELGIGDKVTFWGFVSQQDKFSLLRKAHVLLFPSVREGWGLVVIEAASQGTPSIVYNVPGLRDSVKHNVTGIVLEKKSPEEMANACVSLVQNKDMYNRLQKGSMEWAESLRWEDATKASLSLLEKVVKGHYDK